MKLPVGRVRRARYQIGHRQRRHGRVVTRQGTAILSNAQAAQRFLARTPPVLEELRAILQDIVQDDQRAGELVRLAAKAGIAPATAPRRLN